MILMSLSYVQALKKLTIHDFVTEVHRAYLSRGGRRRHQCGLGSAIEGKHDWLTEFTCCFLVSNRGRVHWNMLWGCLLFCSAFLSSLPTPTLFYLLRHPKITAHCPFIILMITFFRLPKAYASPGSVSFSS